MNNDFPESENYNSGYVDSFRNSFAIFSKVSIGNLNCNGFRGRNNSFSFVISLENRYIFNSKADNLSI